MMIIDREGVTIEDVKVHHSLDLGKRPQNVEQEPPKFVFSLNS